MNGYEDGRFGPGENLSREQLAAILWRYSKSPAATNKELHFNDVDEISGFTEYPMAYEGELTPGAVEKCVCRRGR